MCRNLPIIVLAIATSLVAACGADAGDVRFADPTSVSPGPSASLDGRCTNPEHGFSLSYPADWYTNPGDVLPTCTVFDEEPIELTWGTEIPFDVTALVKTVDRPISQVPHTDLDADRGADEIRRDDERIGGRDVVSIRFRSTGEGLLPEGVTGHRFIVPLGEGRTLVTSTYGLDERPLEDNVGTIRRMLETLET